MEISVIVPTYRPQAYLWQTLDSLLGQTLPIGQYEIILVLNGPTEPYATDILSYISDHGAGDRVRMIISDEAGVSRARNMGIDGAKGDYLCFVDDDDWVTPGYLDSLLATAHKNKSAHGSACIVAADVRGYEMTSGKMLDDYLSRAYRRCAAMDDVTLFQGRSLLSSSCCKLIPRTIIGDYRFDSCITHGEDALFMATLSPAIGALLVAPSDAIYYRRIHGTSASRHRRPWSARLRNTSRLLLRYTRLLLRPWRYNVPFILTRIAATLRRMA